MGDYGRLVPKKDRGDRRQYKFSLYLNYIELCHVGWNDILEPHIEYGNKNKNQEDLIET